MRTTATNAATASWVNQLIGLGACHEAIEWARGYDTPGAAWAACERGDWMLWLYGRLAGPPWSDSRKPLVLACCECARLSLKYVPAGEDRPRVCIETVERWTRGDATREDVCAAAAYASAAAAAAYAAAYASAAAAYASAAAAAAYASADAAAYASAYASADAAADARMTTLKSCADIVRKHYPKPPVAAGKETT